MFLSNSSPTKRQVALFSLTTKAISTYNIEGKLCIFGTPPQIWNISLKHLKLPKNHFKTNLFCLQLKYLKCAFEFGKKMKIWPPPPLIKKSKFRILDFLMFFSDPPPWQTFSTFCDIFNWKASLRTKQFHSVRNPTRPNETILEHSRLAKPYKTMTKFYPEKKTSLKEKILKIRALPQRNDHKTYLVCSGIMMKTIGD